MSLSITTWLAKYCDKKPVKQVGSGIVSGPVRFSRSGLARFIGIEIARGLSLPKPMVLKLIGMNDDVARKTIVQSVSEFLNLANRHLSQDPDFIIECALEAARIYDPDLARHESRVGKLSAALAEKLGVSQPERLLRAGQLHDLGKVGMPRALLDTTKAWGEGDRTLVTYHLTVSQVVAEEIGALHHVGEGIIRYNHYYNGYPEGIKGEEIPIEGQILSIADYFDALTHPRPSRGGGFLTTGAALNKIAERRDPERWPEIRTRYEKRLYDALCAVVCSPHFPEEIGTS